MITIKIDFTDNKIFVHILTKSGNNERTTQTHSWSVRYYRDMNKPQNTITKYHKGSRKCLDSQNKVRSGYQGVILSYYTGMPHTGMYTKWQKSPRIKTSMYTKESSQFTFCISSNNLDMIFEPGFISWIDTNTTCILTFDIASSTLCVILCQWVKKDSYPASWNITTNRSST